MERYLTKKARPGKMALLAENAACLALTAGVLVLLLIGVAGYVMDGLVLIPHLILLGMIVLLLWLLSRLTERKRACKHASVIISALLTGGSMPCEELENLTRVNRVHQRILDLTSQGCLTGVTVEKAVARLTAHAPAQPEAPAAGAAQSKCAMCGAVLVRKDNGIVGCPYCGTNKV